MPTIRHRRHRNDPSKISAKHPSFLKGIDIIIDWLLAASTCLCVWLFDIEQRWLSSVSIYCMSYNCLEWYKWVLTNLYHDRQLYNTFIPPSHESPAVGLRISRLSRSVELTLRYTTPDIHCRHRRHECDGGIRARPGNKFVSHCS